MGKIILSFIALCCIVAFLLPTVKCQVQRDIFVTGKLVGMTSSIATIYKDGDYVFDERIQIGSTSISEDGNFKLRIESFSPEIYSLQIDERFIEHPLYLTVGESLHIQINVVNERWIYSYSGTAEKINRFEKDFYKEFPMDDEYMNNRYSAKSYAQFRTYIDKRKDKQEYFYKDYLHDQPLPERFKNVFESRIRINWLSERVEFLLTHIYFPEKPHYEFDSSFFDFENSILQSDESITHSSSYNSLSHRYIYLLAKAWERGEKNKGHLINGSAFYQKQFEFAKTKFDGFNRDVAVSNVILDIFKSESVLHKMLAKKKLEEFKSFASDTKYFDAYKKYVDKLISLSPGQPAPDFTATDLNGNRITLSQFKGKIVYIDFWATWCGSCIGEIPQSMELQRKFSHDNVVFLHVALEEKNLDGWKKFIKKKKLSGVHVYLEGRTENPLAKKYNVFQLPHVILIDQEGKIISNQVGITVDEKGKSLTQSLIGEKIVDLLKQR